VEKPCSADELVAAFGRWAAGEQARQAALGRARQRSLEEQARASATFTGLLVDSAEASTPVVVVIGAERRNGRIAGVGRDFFVLETPSGQAMLVATAALSALWSAESAGSMPAGPPAGDRQAPLRLSLAAALAALAEEHLPVEVLLAGGHRLSGRLLSVGEDLLSVEVSRRPRRLAAVPLASLMLCEVR
jgi:hypothetical protein